MTLLLTGASGFLGRNVIRHAPRDWRIVALYSHDSSFPEYATDLANPNLTPVRCDLNVPEQVAELFRKYGAEWEYCLHLAAKVDIPWSVREPKNDLFMNAGPLLNLLEHLRAHKFVYFSSGAVYDGSSGEVHPGTHLAPTLPYAISKLTCERYVEFCCRRRRSLDDYLIVRFFGAYGPYEATHKIYTRLIHRFAVERNCSYTIYGDGRNLIDAMYVEDAVDAIARILGGRHWNDTINLAGGHPLALEALVRAVGEALGFSSVQVGKEGPAHESNEFWGSTRDMEEFYGFRPKVTLQEGITRFKEFIIGGRNTLG